MTGLLRAVARVGSTDLIDSDGEIMPKSAWASQVGKIVPFKNINHDFLNRNYFEPDVTYKPFMGAKLTFDLTWKPMLHLSMPHSWEMARIYGIGDYHDDTVDAFAYAMAEPIKYRGLARVRHALLRLWRRFR